MLQSPYYSFCEFAPVLNSPALTRHNVSQKHPQSLKVAVAVGRIFLLGRIDSVQPPPPGEAELLLFPAETSWRMIMVIVLRGSGHLIFQQQHENETTSVFFCFFWNSLGKISTFFRKLEIISIIKASILTSITHTHTQILLPSTITLTFDSHSSLSR